MEKKSKESMIYPFGCVNQAFEAFYDYALLTWVDTIHKMEYGYTNFRIESKSHSDYVDFVWMRLKNQKNSHREFIHWSMKQHTRTNCSFTRTIRYIKGSWLVRLDRKCSFCRLCGFYKTQSLIWNTIIITNCIIQFVFSLLL